MVKRCSRAYTFEMRPGATRRIYEMEGDIYRFQSSLDPEAGCNGIIEQLCVGLDNVSILPRP